MQKFNACSNFYHITMSNSNGWEKLECKSSIVKKCTRTRSMYVMLYIKKWEFNNKRYSHKYQKWIAACNSDNSYTFHRTFLYISLFHIIETGFCSRFYLFSGILFSIFIFSTIALFQLFFSFFLSLFLYFL